MSCECDQRNTWPAGGCCNPCSASAANTAECETLPSQISNFTKSFFGEVTKTELDGEVQWVLPCNLETGLENNPRAPDEGLACYFLRLFQDGILGLTGPTGAAGNDGADGFNAYTVTTQTFLQPSLSDPNRVIRTAYNPAIMENLVVFVRGSGWYVVNSYDLDGALHGTVISVVSGTAYNSAVTAGKLVAPTGPQGVSVVGPTGPTGPQGPTGASGPNPTAVNDWVQCEGDPWFVQVAYTQVQFSGGTIQDPELLLPDAGEYRVEAILDLQSIPDPTETFPLLKFKFQLDGGDVSGSEIRFSNMQWDTYHTLTFWAYLTTSGVNQQVTLWANAGTADRVYIRGAKTRMAYVRLS